MNGAVLGAQFQRAEVNRPSGKGKTAKVPDAAGICVTEGGPMLSPHPLTAPQQPLQAGEQDGKLKRFWQVVIRARGKTFQHILGAAASGEHQHGHVVSRGAQLRDHLETILLGQHDVEHHRVKLLLSSEQEIGRALAITDDLGLVTFGLEIETQPLRQVRLVLHYQDPAHPSALCEDSSLGNSMVTVVPCPSPALAAEALPPCFRAMDFTMNNPKPVPLMCARERFPTR